jgi:hypothetical protein
MRTFSVSGGSFSDPGPCHCLRVLSAERFCESRMREIRTSGSTRGEEVGLPPRFPFYSTDDKRRHVCATRRPAQLKPSNGNKSKLLLPKPQ